MLAWVECLSKDEMDFRFDSYPLERKFLLVEKKEYSSEFPCAFAGSYWVSSFLSLGKCEFVLPHLFSRNDKAIAKMVTFYQAEVFRKKYNLKNQGGSKQNVVTVLK